MERYAYITRGSLLSCLFLAIVLLPSVSFAFYLTQFEITFGSMYCKLMLALEGTIGRAIVTSAIVFLGILAYLGRIQWHVAIITVIGILAVSSGPKLVSFIAGSIIPGMDWVLDQAKVDHSLITDNETYITCAAAMIAEVGQEVIWAAGYSPPGPYDPENIQLNAIYENDPDKSELEAILKSYDPSGDETPP